MSLIIEISNSYSRVKGLTPELFRAIKKVLSYEADAQATFFSGGYARTKYLIDAKGSFPTGLLPRLESYLQDKGISYVLEHITQAPKKTLGMFKFDSKGLVPYVFQAEAMYIACANGRGGLEMCTGSGKSLVMALLIYNMQVKTLVIVPTLELKNQLSISFKQWFGNLDNITIENIASSALKKAHKYDMLILDEVHHSASKTYQDLNKNAWKDIYHRYFFSGTFFRNQDSEQLLFESIAGQRIFKFSYKEAVEAKCIVPVEAYYYVVPTSKTNGETWGPVYTELVVKNTVRNEMVASTLLNLSNSGLSTLCLVKEIEHGNILSALTGLPFANGADEDSRKNIAEFSAGRIKVLIGTTGILGEGVDSKPCEYVIVAGLGKAKSAFMQQIGRGVRKYPGKESTKIIIFQDKSHKWTVSHFNAQKKILFDEYGVKVVKL